MKIVSVIYSDERISIEVEMKSGNHYVISCSADDLYKLVMQELDKGTFHIEREMAKKEAKT